jgi:hypothetical protein
MREPQPTSILGAVGRVLNPAWHRIVKLLTVTALTASVLCPVRAHAQLRGQAAPKGPSYGWWLSGGGAAMTIRDVSDGKSQSVWSFGTDATWMSRASIEKAIDEVTSIGLVGAYGAGSLLLRPMVPGDSSGLPAACQVECPASAKVWTGMLQFRSGGGEGFHTFIEADGGATAFREFKTKSDGLPVTALKNTVDLTGTFGLGFGYSFSRGTVITVVQDAGIGMHSKDGLPANTSRYWKTRTLRASLRMKFGGF